jgi:hypothetical protein
LGLLRKMLISIKDVLAAAESDLQEGLRKAGMDINMGPGGTGNLLLVFERLGGERSYFCLLCHVVVIDFDTPRLL